MMMRRVVQVSMRQAKNLVVPLTRAQSVLAEPAVRLFSTSVASSTPAFSLRQASSFSIKSLGAAPARHYAGSYPAHKVLALPALSPSMEKGTLVKWLVEVGSEIKEGNALAEVETDKAAMTWDSTESGFIAKILVPGGTKDIPIDAPLAVFVENKSDVEAFANFTFSGAPAAAPAAAAPAAAAAAPAAAAPVAVPTAPVASGSGSTVPPVPGRRLFASPAARATAAEKNVELTGVAGTGPNGRIIKNDVIAASAAVKSTPALDSVPLPTLSSASFGGAPAFTDIENSQIRKVTASRLTQSKQTIPHYYLTIDFSVDELEKIRQQLNQQSGGEFKLSINDFVIKASALALRQVPEVNSAWNETSIRRYHNVGINVAVNTDYGLFTPLIPTTDNKGLVEINKTVKELADKAKAKKLTPNDLEIGTFTISNLGMFGIKQFAAVINPPQACILAVGGLEERVVVNKAATGEHDRFKVSKFMNCTLSCDHRVVDGALGAKWLAAFRKNIENPLNMLL